MGAAVSPGSPCSGNGPFKVGEGGAAPLGGVLGWEGRGPDVHRSLGSRGAWGETFVCFTLLSSTFVDQRRVTSAMGKTLNVFRKRHFTRISEMYYLQRGHCQICFMLLFLKFLHLEGKGLDKAEP